MDSKARNRASLLGLRIISGHSSITSKPLKAKIAVSSFAPSSRFLMPLNTPVLVRVVDHLRTMTVDEVALVEVVAKAIRR